MKTSFQTKLLLPLLIGLLFTPCFAGAQSNEDALKKEALKATTAWLEKIDKGEYATSWKVSSKLFQETVLESRWVDALNQARKPLGKCLERKVASQLYQTGIPMADGKTLKGNFVITQFESSFENLKAAMETVTFEKEADGKWRASGYFIKPR